MDALVAMQINSLFLASFLMMAILFRFMLKQLGYSLFYKYQYELALEQKQAVLGNNSLDTLHGFGQEIQPAI